MSRRPKIDISAVTRIDAVPLRQALAIQSKTLAELEKHRARKEALEKEIADFIANTDPDDEKRLHLISGKKIQVDVLVGMIGRLENQLIDKHTPDLARETDKFKGELRRFYQQIKEVIATTVADIIRPYFSSRANPNGEVSDRALVIARGCDDCGEVYARQQRLEQIRISEEPRQYSDAAGSGYDRNLADAATALLALAEEP